MLKYSSKCMFCKAALVLEISLNILAYDFSFIQQNISLHYR